MLRYVFLLIVAVSSLSYSQITQKDFLKVSTGAANETWNNTTPKSTWHIVNTTGAKVFLRGVNAGGWLVHEPWMTPVNDNTGDHVTVMNQLKTRFNAAKRDELIAIYEDNYWTETDFNNCATMGMSVIRLPFTYMNLVYVDGGATHHTLKPDAFKRLDWFVENCQKRGMYVILDMHGAFGSQNGQDHSGEVNNGWELYTGANAAYNQDKTVWLWGEIAKRYKDNPTVAMYDIINEPGPKAGVTNKTQWDVYDKIYKKIRENDPNHIICMESCWGTGNLPKTTQYGWTNTVYQYHHYSWDNISNEQGQKNFYTARVNEVRGANHGNPTFIGEFTCFGLQGAWDFCMKTYNDAGWHYTSWTYKVKNNSSWGIYNHTPGDVNVFSDSEAQIRDKWSKVGADNAWANTMVRNEIMKKMPGTIGGDNPYTTANLALNKPIIASSQENDQLKPSNANDGSASSRWASLWESPASITVDLQDTYSINGVRLLWEAAFAVKYTVEVSTDNSTWTNVKTETAGSGGINNINVSNVPARYVRVTGTERTTIAGQLYGYSLYEFEVYGNKVTKINIPGTFNSLDYSAKSNEIKDNNDSHGKYIGNLVNGSFVEYTINVATAGTYNMSIQAAAGNSTQQRSLSVFAKGARVATVSVANGTDWFAFAPISADIPLTSGEQTLRIVSTGAVNIENISITAADAYVIIDIPESGLVYNGAQQKPAVTSVVFGGKTLSAATDYDVTYANNIQAGIATVTVKGKAGAYPTLNITRNFTIAKKDLFITLDPKEYVIDAGGDLPNFNQHVAFNGFVMPAGGDKVDDHSAIYYTDSDKKFEISDISVFCGYKPQEPVVGDYRLTLSVQSELYSNNYNIIFDDAQLHLTVREEGSPVKAKQKSRDRFGIVVEKNPVSADSAVISVRASKNSYVSIVIYDNVGNVIFAKKDVRVQGNSADVVWKLTNLAGKVVSNGSYLIIADTKDSSGKTSRYTGMLGIKR